MKIRENFLPFATPFTGEEEYKEVVDAVKSGWLSTGPRTRKFEADIAAYIGVKPEQVVAVNSCTAALHIAVAAAGLGPGDEVITSPLTFAATVNVILHEGATPVLADIDPVTLNIDPKAIEAKITDKTRAIMPVHYAGQSVDMDPILELAEKHNLVVIEDAAHGIGSQYKGRSVGAMGDFAGYSFYAIKNMTTGEGGALIINSEDEEVIKKCRSLALHGISKDAWKRYTNNGSWYYEIHHAGFKYNMNDLAAALGLHQLQRLDGFIASRQQYSAMYDQAFSDMPEVSFTGSIDDVRHTKHLYPLLLNLDKLNIDRNKFIDELRDRKVGTSVHYIPIHVHPYYRNRFGYKDLDYPVCFDVYTRLISMPLYPSMTIDDVYYVIDAVKDIVRQNRKTLAFSTSSFNGSSQ